jgi:glycosyl hydrolase family 39 (putative alpha-L-iduronidase)
MKEMGAMAGIRGRAVYLFAMIALLSAQADGKYQLVPSSQRIPANFFGMHIHHATTGTPWPSVPIGGWRLWDALVAWPQIEPRKGEWSFGLLDQYVSMAEQHQTEVLLPLGLSPQWASARPLESSVYQPGNAAEPADNADWRNYVTAVVTRYKGRIGAYEIWNEPNNKGFWTGDTQKMVALTQEASEIIHRIDPTAFVVSPAATTNSGIAWLSQFLNLGGGRYVDVIAYHFYVSPQPPEAMVPLIEQVRQIMSDTGVSDKPLWNTESGWQVPKPFPSADLAAAYLARAYILNWASGVSRFYWYAWDNHAWVSIQTTGADSRTLTPAGQAYGIIEKWLGQAELNNCEENADHAWSCRLTRNGVPLWILWNPLQNTAERRTFLFPQPWNDKSLTPLLGTARSLNGPEIEVGQMPELVTSSDVP